jgi:DNA repair exonuclease SbcCD ATPase subunit
MQSGEGCFGISLDLLNHQRVANQISLLRKLQLHECAGPDGDTSPAVLTEEIGLAAPVTNPEICGWRQRDGFDAGEAIIRLEDLSAEDAQESLLTLDSSHAAISPSFTKAVPSEQSELLSAIFDLERERNEILMITRDKMKQMKLTIQQKDEQISSLMTSIQQSNHEHEASLDRVHNLLIESESKYESGMETYQRDKQLWENRRRKVSLTAAAKSAELEERYLSTLEMVKQNDAVIDTLTSQVDSYEKGFGFISSLLQISAGECSALASTNSNDEAANCSAVICAIGHLTAVGPIINAIGTLLRDREAPILEAAHLRAEILSMEKVMQDKSKSDEEYFTVKYNEVQTTHETELLKTKSGLKEMQHLLEQQAAQLAVLLSDHDLLTNELKETKASLAEEVLRRARLSKTAAQTESLCREMEGRNFDLREKLCALQQELDDKNISFQTLSSASTQLQKSLVAAEAIMERYNSEDDDYQSIDEAVDDKADAGGNDSVLNWRANEKKFDRLSKMLKQTNMQLVIRNKEHASLLNRYQRELPTIHANQELLKKLAVQENSFRALEEAKDAAEAHISELLVLLSMKQGYIDDSKRVLEATTVEYNQSLEALQFELLATRHQLHDAETATDAYIADHMEQERVEHSRRLKDAVDMAQDLRSKLLVANAAIDELKQRVCDEQLTQASLNALIADSRTEYSNLMDLKSSSDAHIDGLQVIVKVKDEEIAGLRAQLANVEAVRAYTEDAVGQCKDEIYTLQTQLSHTQLRLEGKEKEIGQLEEENRMMQSDFDHLNLSFEGTAVGLKNHIHELEVELQELKLRLQRAQGIVDQLSIDDHRTIIANMCVELDNSKIQLTSLTAEAAQLRLNLADKSQICERLTGDVHTLTTRVTELEDQLEPATAYNKAIEAEMIEKTQQVMDLMERETTFREQLQSSFNQIASLTSELAGLTSQTQHIPAVATTRIPGDNINNTVRRVTTEADTLLSEVEGIINSSDYSGTISPADNFSSLADSLQDMSVVKEEQDNRCFDHSVDNDFDLLLQLTSNPGIKGPKGAYLNTTSNDKSYLGDSGCNQDTEYCSSSETSEDNEEKLVGCQTVTTKSILSLQSDLIRLQLETEEKTMQLYVARTKINSLEQDLVNCQAQMSSLKCDNERLRETINDLNRLLIEERDKATTLERDLQTVTDVAVKQIKLQSPKKQVRT